MKRILLLISLIIFIAKFLFAADFATDKGSKMLIGNFAFSSMGGEFWEDENNNRYNSFQTNPIFSYFLLPGFSVGGKLLYAKVSQGAPHGFREINWGFGPSIAYYIRGNKKPSGSVNHMIYPYLTASYLYTETEIKKNEESFEDIKVGSTISFGIGLLTMLGNSVGVSLEFSYDLDKLESVKGNKYIVLLGFNVFDY